MIHSLKFKHSLTTFIIFRIKFTKINYKLNPPQYVHSIKDYSDILVEDDFTVKPDLKVNFKLFPNLDTLNINKLYTSPFFSYKLYVEHTTKYYICINSPVYIKTFDILNNFNPIQTYIFKNKNNIISDILINSILLQVNNISLIHLYYSNEKDEKFLCLPVNGFIEDDFPTPEYNNYLKLVV